MSAPITPVQDSGQDIRDWAGSPLSTLHHGERTQPIPTEEYLADGRYRVRFELPGIDPEKDLEVSVEAQILTVHAERHAITEAKYHSQFRYGAFCAHVTLPAGVDDSNITASYENGILEVTVGFEAPHAARTIKVVTARETS